MLNQRLDSNKYAFFYIFRPVLAILLLVSLVLLGGLALLKLPVAPLPQVDFPVISVQASLPGASPEVMASSVAQPLERLLGALSGVNEITSVSSLGTTRISLQFDLERSIHAAAKEVQGVLNTAKSILPTGMPTQPTFKKVNPAESPIMVFSLTSEQLSRGQLYEFASNLLSQRFSQIAGIGQVTIGGGASPAVRVQVEADQLSALGISLESVKSAIINEQSRVPMGALQGDYERWQIIDFPQDASSEAMAKISIKQSDHTVVRLGSVARLVDSVQDVRTFGSSNGQPAVLLILYRQPSANIIQTVDQVKAALPQLQALLPETAKLAVMMDRTTTIRASVQDAQITLLASVLLVSVVMWLFLGSWRDGLMTAITIPAVLLGTLAVMSWLGFSLNNLSLMALIVVTGFIVDDSIVMIEAIHRRMQAGESPLASALYASQTLTFTLTAISLSLVAIFLPLALMGGLIGRFFQEFSLTLVVAVLLSLVVAIVVIPALSGRWLTRSVSHSSVWQNVLQGWYRRTLAWALRHLSVLLLVMVSVIVFTVYLYIHIDKGFLPQQDTGRMIGRVQADQSISYEAMRDKLARFVQIIQSDPDVATVTAYTGSGVSNSAIMFISLKGKPERQVDVETIINRLRPQTQRVAGAKVFISSVQDFRMSAQATNANYALSIRADQLEQLTQAEESIRQALANLTELTDVNSDREARASQTYIHIDRERANALGLTMRDVQLALQNAFSQRLIATLYDDINQYRVVLEVSEDKLRSEKSLDQLFLVNAKGERVSLLSVASVSMTQSPLSVVHTSGFPSATVSFNLAQGVSFAQAEKVILATIADLTLSRAVQVSFQGSAKASRDQQRNQPWLILGAVIALYLILGILYESLLHPLTLLSTLPSAGLGALLILMLTDTEFTLMALIGVFLLMGLVIKNAILMIDTALVLQRQSRTPAQAIFLACQQRFRPIMMTSVAAMMGAVPLIIAGGEGSELRTPLGISIVGGLVVSQFLTLYTTPAVYLGFEKVKMSLLGKG